MTDNEGALDLRLLGVDLDDNEARDLADEVYGHLNRLWVDVDGVAPVLREVDHSGPVGRIEVQQNSDETALVTLDGSVRLAVDAADVDGSDNLTFYRENSSIAHVKVLGVPLEVPRLIRRAIEHSERGVWK